LMAFSAAADRDGLVNDHSAAIPFFETLSS